MTTRAVLAALVAGGLGLGAQAQELGDEEMASAREFMLNNALFVFYHELGHMFVSEFGLPVLGREEDAADNLAAFLLLNAEEGWADQALIDAADGWYYGVSEDQLAMEDDSYLMGEHSLDLQRSYAAVCLMVGEDPAGFAQVAESYGLPPDRVESCAFTWEQVDAGWGGLLEPRRLPEGAEPPAIEVVYEETADYEAVRQLLMADGFLEWSAAMVGEGYDLPRPVAFRAAECGEANAYWDPSEATATLCYELVDFYYGVYVGSVLGYGAEGENAG